MAARNRKLLVTGGAGFIGSEFVRQAVRSGHQVAVIDKLTYAGDLARLREVRGDISFYKTDILSFDKVRNIIKKEKPSALVHFAAESHVDRSIVNDVEFIRTNINGTQNLLGACREARIKRFIHISTDEVYGDNASGTLKESSLIKPSSPYSASKAAGDMLVSAYVRTFRFPAIIVRPSNNYGPGQFPEKFIPVIINNAMRDKHIPVYGKGTNIREWLHVSDCAAGILKILEKGREGQIYNLGSGCRKKNVEVVKAILKVMGKPNRLISFVKDRPGHDLRYAIDSSKAARELSWKPKVSFEDGISSTVAWYQEHHENIRRHTII